MNTQTVVWLPANGLGRRQVEVGGCKRPQRVWTLCLNLEESNKPELPYSPRHHHNAFIEEHLHDWNYRNGMLTYYSRTMDVKRGCWLLIEW